MASTLIYKGKSDKYKRVYIYEIKDVIMYQGVFGKKHRYFKTEKEAALFVDKKLIELGKEPVNILVRK